MLGVAFDVAGYDQLPGLSVPLFLTGVVALSYRTLRRSVLDDVSLGLAIVFSGFAALRASEPLAALNILAAIGLLGLVATSHTSSTVLGLLQKLMELARAALGAPVFLVRPVSKQFSRLDLGRARPWLHAAVLGVPVVIVFAALLASADRVFADAITPDLPSWDLSEFVAHAFLVLAGSLGAGCLWRSALRRRGAGAEARGWSGVATERVPFHGWLFALAALDLLFFEFVAVQFAVLFGGSGRVHVTPGLTYAEYARSGFLQLIVVSILATLVILGIWDFGRTAGARERVWFRGLVTAMIVLTGVILASALKRLALYEDTFGFTLARFTGYVTMALIATFLGGTLLLVWLNRRKAIVVLAIGCVVTGLAAVNLLSPERFVARRNVARFNAAGKVDPYYLGFGLGYDAVPAKIAMLARLEGDEARILRNALCGDARALAAAPSGWRSANVARSVARDALRKAGLGPRACRF